MPQERSAEDKKADSLQLVVDLIDKVNANQSDFATADSKALKQIHTELNKVSQLVRNFLEYSTNLINDEGIRNTIRTFYKIMQSDITYISCACIYCTNLKQLKWCLMLWTP